MIRTQAPKQQQQQQQPDSRLGWYMYGEIASKSIQGKASAAAAMRVKPGLRSRTQPPVLFLSLSLSTHSIQVLAARAGLTTPSTLLDPVLPVHTAPHAWREGERERYKEITRSVVVGALHT